MKMQRKAHYYWHRSPLWFSAITAGAASCVSLIGGIGLEAVEQQILPIIPLIVALPALNTMVGDYAAIIAAHAGDPAERPKTKRQLARAIAKAIVVNIVGVIILSIGIAAYRGYLFTGLFLVKFSAFVIISIIAVVGLMFVITIFLDKLLEQRKTNPDDLLIPVVTSITDVMMLGLIALAAVTLFN